MSFFNFLKKQQKTGGDTQTLELPPLPEFPTQSNMFGEMPAQEMPHLEETGLPPLPTQVLPPQVMKPQPSVIPRNAMQQPFSPTGLPPLEETLGMAPKPRNILDELPPPPDFRKPVVNLTENENAPSRIPTLELHGIATITPPTPVHVRSSQGPIFVRMDQYRQTLQYIEEIKVTFKSEENIFLRVNDMKNARDQKFETLHDALEDLQRKLLFVDKTVFER